MNEHKSILTIKGVNKFYGKFQALSNINLKVEEGEFLAILGESGSGKSTLLNVISGLDTLSSGEITINGITTRDFSHKEWAIYRNHYVGFIFQEYNLVDHLTVVENVELPLLLQGVKADIAREKALEKCKLMGLSSHTHKLPKKISGGQQQRVAIARALVTEPKVILADEPTGALDSENAKIILDILKVLSKDHIVILVTHDEEYAKHYATRIVTLEDGKIISDTNKQEIGYESTQALNLKRPNMKLKVLWKFARNNLKSRLARTFFTSFTMALGLIAIFLIVFLINGIRTEITDIVSRYIPKSQYVIRSLISSGQLTDEDYEFVNDEEIVSEAFFKYQLYPLTNNQSHFEKPFEGVPGQTYYEEDDYRLETIPNHEKNYNNLNELVGDYPKNDNEVIITSGLAEKILSFTVKESELKDALGIINNNNLKLKVIRISAEAELNEEYKIVGIIFNSNKYAYLRHSKMDELLDHITEDDITKYYGNRIINKAELNVYLTTDDEDSIAEFETELYGEDLILTNPTKVIFNSINGFFDTVLKVLLSTASVSLFVSGILVGLMIYISVLERVKEIGILTAVGARRSNIRNLFIFESSFLGFLSSFISLLFALLISWMINSIFNATVVRLFRTFNITIFEDFKLLHIDLLTILIVFGIAIGYAILCGLIPAFIASRLRVVEALRKE